MLFRSLGIRFCSLHRSIAVFWRSVKSIESQSIAARIDNIVARPRRNEDRVTAVDFGRFAVDPYFSLPFFDSEKLIGARVHFLADLFTGLQGHEDELNILSCIQYAPEIRIVICQLLDVRNKAFKMQAFFGLRLRLASVLAALLGNGRGA